MKAWDSSCRDVRDQQEAPAEPPSKRARTEGPEATFVSAGQLGLA